MSAGLLVAVAHDFPEPVEGQQDAEGKMNRVLNRYAVADEQSSSYEQGRGEHGLGGFGFGKAEEPVETPWLRFEGAYRQPLNLELPGIGWKLAPLRNPAGCDADQVGEGLRVLRVADGVLCSHSAGHFSTLNTMSASSLNPLDGLIDGMALKDRIIEAQGTLTNAKFAKAVGVSAAAVTQWRDGSTKSLKGDVATKMERVTGYRADWILNGRLPKRADNVEQGPDVKGTVPLLSNVQAGMYREFFDNFHPGDGGLESIPTTVQINRHTFALRVVGDSMEPRFTAGMILIIEPEMEANPGDFVIAKNGDDETTFKQLIKDGGDLYLKPLNDRYPIKPLGDSRIIGVVRAASLSFR